jgi:predicted amidohydrolase|tara:strand:+ start:223 stop:999 length:777 start_codon:yes stop_codon:yes gene_type:complete
MKNNLNITLVQSELFWENVNSNLSSFEKLISNVKVTDIILLPEMFNTSFCPQSNHLAESMEGKTINWMKEIAETKNCDIAGTLMVKEDDKVFNRLVWISKNKAIYTYDKYHLFSLIKEQKYISKGNKRLIIELEGYKVCPLICYDLRFPVFSRNDVEYDLLIYLANWPVKRIDAWDTLLKARSIENQCYTIGVNRIGKDGNQVSFNGHSKVFDAFGKELFSASENKEEVLQFEISLHDLKLKRRNINFLDDRDSFLLI